MAIIKAVTQKIISLPLSLMFAEASQKLASVGCLYHILKTSHSYCVFTLCCQWNCCFYHP